MKKKLSLILFALVAFGAAEVYAATPEPNISLVQKGEKTYVMKLSPPTSDLSVSIKDGGGLVLYSEVAHAGSAYQKTYDFSQLPQGYYAVEVENEFLIKTATIKVSSDRIDVSAEHTTLHKPVVKLNGEFLDVNFLNLKEKAVEFKIYDSRGHLVFSQELNKDVLLSKRYDISHLPSDNYSVVVYNNGRLLTKTILL